MKPVVMFDAVAQVRALRGEIDEAIGRVLESGRFLLGEEVTRFERDFAAYLGGGGAGVAVSSGTDALELALRALGVESNHEVVTVPNTAVATVSAIRQLGARPVLCDVDPITGLMDLEKLAACLSDATRAVVPVHLYGNMVDVPALRAALGDRSATISIVEDCAQAHGALLGEQLAGTLGDAAAFSFYPTKNLGALGDAGLCYSADPEVVRAVRSLRRYGIEDAAGARREGINSRMDEIQAAILSVKLRHLDTYLTRRRTLAARYDERLDPAIPRIPAAEGVTHAYHLYGVRLRGREAAQERLAQAGVGTAVHYPVPVHRMPAYAFLGYEPGSLPAAERWAEEVLSLPLYPELADADVDRVAAAVNDAAA
ncbi:MAG: DegT/DnrJ/EryC1/StrS family aminotransferase [Proteobacteria bacterium]|nr:DegT/DnrJ/EryC1/StrS family aminotransferase [Pseudomonadota bacterium]